MDYAECRDCGEIFDIELLTCPKCGSHHRNVFLGGEATTAFDAIATGMRARDKRYKGKHKDRWEWIHAPETSNEGIKVIHFRVFDRDNDRYEEVVTDDDTGEVIYECKEPLSKHIGHGSAKKK